MLKELSKSFPPGLEYAIAFDSTTSSRLHPRSPRHPREAIVIVIVVIFLFLLDWRATSSPPSPSPSRWSAPSPSSRYSASPSTRSPSSHHPGHRLVVDDAIVVIENVQRHIAPSIATPQALRSHVRSHQRRHRTSLVLIAVFVPVSFFPAPPVFCIGSSR